MTAILRDRKGFHKTHYISRRELVIEVAVYQPLRFTPPEIDSPLAPSNTPISKCIQFYFHAWVPGFEGDIAEYREV